MASRASPPTTRRPAPTPAASAPAPDERSRPARSPRARAAEARPWRAGTIALVGRPNVGKSTLLNALLGTRLAITSHHPQTTRDRIAGILTADRTQFVFLDTPGVHTARSRLGERMNDLAASAAADADLVLFVTDVALGASPELRPADRSALAAIPPGKPAVLVINKIDRVPEKAKLFEVLASYATLYDFQAVVPLSAKKRDGTARLLEAMRPLLPEGEPLYPEDELSDRPVRFFVAELVREQVLMRTRQEVPHGVAVTIDAFEEPSGAGKKKQVTRITLTIHVAKESHKGIIIGQGGKMLAAIGTAARERAERLLEQQVHLDVHVRTTPDWFDDAARLVELGYADELRPKRKKAAKKDTRRNVGGDE